MREKLARLGQAVASARPDAWLIRRDGEDIVRVARDPGGKERDAGTSVWWHFAVWWGPLGATFSVATAAPAAPAQELVAGLARSLASAAGPLSRLPRLDSGHVAPQRGS